MASRGVAHKYIAQNRKARRNYFIEDTLESGIILQGTEVKSLRDGKVSLNEAYAETRAGELFLVNAHIGVYEHGNRQNHEPMRPRKLLVHRREIDRLSSKVHREGYTLVPLSMYFNERGRAKVELALARGRKHYDKREREKTRDWQRQKARVLRDRNR